MVLAPVRTESAHRALVGLIEDAARAGVASCDPQQQLDRSTADAIVQVLVEALYDHQLANGRARLSQDDHAYIREMTRRLTKARLPKPAASSKRFAMFDRVVCCVGGERGWAAGTVQALDQDDVFPYVVKIDQPDTRLVSIPSDTSEQVRAEVCFGQRAGAAHFTRMCLPRAARQRQRTPRFAEGDRVACAVEDATSEYSDWAPGATAALKVGPGLACTVVAVDHTVEAWADWAGFEDRTVPYLVRLDAGGEVLVHRDEHWLIRELALQPAGPRVQADGTRCLAKFTKRAAEDGWQVVDHATRKVRKVRPGEPDEDDDEAAGCAEERCGACRTPAEPPPPPQQEEEKEEEEEEWEQREQQLEQQGGCADEGCEEGGCGGCRPQAGPPPPPQHHDHQDCEESGCEEGGSEEGGCGGGRPSAEPPPAEPPSPLAGCDAGEGCEEEGCERVGCGACRCPPCRPPRDAAAAAVAVPERLKRYF